MSSRRRSEARAEATSAAAHAIIGAEMAKRQEQVHILARAPSVPPAALEIAPASNATHVEFMLSCVRQTIAQEDSCKLPLNTSAHRVPLSIFMPDMNGWELSRALRERDSKIPVAVITGWGEAVGSHERQAAQVDWVVAKPFETPQIVELAREVLRRQLAQRKTEVAVAAA